MNKIFFYTITLTLFYFLFSCQTSQLEKEHGKHLEVSIDREKGKYFLLNGQPTLLVGGSNNDNIFQDHPIEPQLDTLVKYGGNYIRCTLSSRDFANQWPYQQRGDALYDLNVFSEAYWSRLDKFLKITQEKGIIVQLEIWDTRDYLQANNWAKHPFNPEYNINYTEEVGLPTSIEQNQENFSHPFFYSVPQLNNNKALLRFQEMFVEQVMSTALSYNHVIYCINNEFNGDVAWSKYWHQFIKNIANEKGKEIIVGDMPGNINMSNSISANWFTFKELDFLDLSILAFKNNYTAYIDSVQKNIQKPIALVKIFGGEQYDYTGNIEDGPKRFWLSLFTGTSAVRFHQPPQGAGLNRLAQVNLKSVQLLNAESNLTKLKPATNRLIDRQPEEAYCISDLDREYCIYFPGCGEVKLDFPKKYQTAQVMWLNILNAQWEENYIVEKQDSLTLKSPCEGKWITYIQFEP